MDKRQKIIKLFEKIYNENGIDDYENKAILSENSVFNKYPFTDKENIKRSSYYQKIVQIVSHLKPNKSINNNTIINSIKSGKINVKDLGIMTPKELFPLKWKPLEDRLELERKHNIEGQSAIFTNQFTCRRCNKKPNKCSYYQLQTRSADEGISTFITCTYCGNHWCDK